MPRLNKKQIFKKLEDLINKNCCKYLSGASTQKTFVYVRDRKEQTSYYLMTARGNYLRAYRINYVDPEGNWINTFLSITIPVIINGKDAGEVIKKEIVRKRELIAKQKLNDFDKFAADFRANSESLGWDL